jgi:hypothetical protein
LRRWRCPRGHWMSSMPRASIPLKRAVRKPPAHGVVSRAVHGLPGGMERQRDFPATRAAWPTRPGASDRSLVSGLFPSLQGISSATTPHFGQSKWRMAATKNTAICQSDTNANRPGGCRSYPGRLR